VRIGYACLTIGVPGTEIKSCTLKNADEVRLVSLVAHNLESLENMVDYNIQNGIMLFRITSDIIPFGSSVAAGMRWEAMFPDRLSRISRKIKGAKMRVSMHPGQYTVLNSPDEDVVKRAAADLEYHARVLDSMDLGPEHKIVLHTGGVYGDKKQAMRRFLWRYANLSPTVRARLVLENDDTAFHIGDVLEIASAAGIPAAYDCLHNAVNPADRELSDADWIARCAPAWRESDGAQKIHYSQQHPDRKPGAHSGTIAINEFMEFYGRIAGREIDVMLEVKDKNLSALKCIHCTRSRGIAALESEWARYKYSVLERSQADYLRIRRLLSDKKGYPALDFYRMVESALRMPVSAGQGANAAQHVWGYFKGKASAGERLRFEDKLSRFLRGEASLASIKACLKRLAVKYDEKYLLRSYYFYI
jgi:UV DNA damage endonuclease